MLDICILVCYTLCMMNKIINKINKYSVLSILAILAFGAMAFMPAKANAQYYYQPYNYSDYVVTNQNTNNNNANNNTNNNNGNNNNGNTNNNGYYYGNNNYTAAPVIYSITPNKTTDSATSTTVNISGANFNSGSVARLNGYDKETTYYDSTHLSMNVRSNDLSGYGTYLVTVFNFAASQVSNSTSFTYSKALPVTPTATKTATKATAGTVAKTTTNSNLDLTAGAGNGFVPGNLLGWLVAAILILILVYLYRLAYIGQKEKDKHLKHA